MKPLLRYSFAMVLVFILSMMSQATTVTGTLVDPSGQSLINAKIHIEFQGPPGIPGSPTITPVDVQADSNGGFTTILIGNDTINPARSTYIFTICPNASTQCSIVHGVTIAGASQDVSATLNAGINPISVNAQTLLPKAYKDSEIPVVDLTNIGAMYWNVTDKSMHLWDGTAWSGIPSSVSFRGVIDASLPQFAAADMCASMNLARSYAISLGLSYAEISMKGFHGRQDVNTNCWANTPSNGTSPEGFLELDYFASDTKAVTSVNQNPLTSTIIDGGSPWIWPHSNSTDLITNQGFKFIPSDTFNWGTQKAVLTLGFSGGTTNPRGLWLTRMGVECLSLSGIYTSGSKGILNALSQEMTGGEHVFVYNCTEGIDIEWDAAFVGSQNSGGWHDINIQAPNIPASETAYIGFNYCGHTAGARCKMNKGVDGGTINGPIGATTGVGVSVNSGNFAVRNLSMEALNYGVDIGTVNQAFGVTIDNVTTEGHSDTRTTAIIHGSLNNQTSFTALNISANASPFTDYIIQDEGTDGQSICGVNTATVGRPCNGATKTTASISLYSCTTQAGYGVSRKCLPNAATPPAAGGEVTSTLNGNYTTTIADNGKLIRMTPAANNVTFTLPATPPFANWYVWVQSVNNLGFTTSINSSGTAIDGNPTSTTPITIPQTQTMLITTNGTTYHTVRPWVLTSDTLCSNSTSPATCTQAGAGSVALPAAATTLQVNTTRIGTNSQVFVFENTTVGARIGIGTCNTTTGRVYSVTAKTAGVSFTITSSAAPVTNPACLDYVIVNPL